MALKDWGPLSAAKKQSEISAAFEAVKDKVNLDDLDKLKQAIYNKLKETYKLNQAKFKTWEKFWANANYEKHLIYLQGLVDVELEARAVADGSYSYTSKSKSGNGASGSGSDDGTGAAADNGMTTLLVVGVIAVVVVLLIKKFKKQ